MPGNHLMITLLLLLSVCCSAADADSGRCYRIEPATIAGIVGADVLLTVVIVVVTYQWATRRRQRNDSANAVYMNVRANCKT